MIKSAIRSGMLLVLLLVLAKAPMLHAQVSIIEHGPFSEMLDRYKAINRDPETKVQGYRIQIVSTTDRLKLEEAMRKFSNVYPNYKADWVHEPPFYKLRVGAFLDKGRAAEFLSEIKRSFPSAYPAQVRDIQPGELLDYL